MTQAGGVFAAVIVVVQPLNLVACVGDGDKVYGEVRPSWGVPHSEVKDFTLTQIGGAEMGIERGFPYATDPLSSVNGGLLSEEGSDQGG